MAHRLQRGVLVDLPDALAALLPPLRYLGQQRLQPLLQLSNTGGKPVLLSLRQPRVVLGGQRVRTPRRCKDKAAGGAQQQHLALLGLVAQRRERGFLPLVELILNGIGLGAVLIALEQGRNRAAQVVHQLRQLVSQRHAAARGQPHRLGLVRLAEIVQVAPVRQAALVWRVLGQQLAHQAALAHAGRAQHKQVEALLPDPHAKAHRLGGARLPDQRVQALQLGRGLKLELRQVTGLQQLRRRQPGPARHGHLRHQDTWIKRPRSPPSLGRRTVRTPFL